MSGPKTRDGCPAPHAEPKKWTAAIQLTVDVTGDHGWGVKTTASPAPPEGRTRQKGEREQGGRKGSLRTDTDWPV